MSSQESYNDDEIKNDSTQYTDDHSNNEDQYLQYSKKKKEIKNWKHYGSHQFESWGTFSDRIKIDEGKLLPDPVNTYFREIAPTITNISEMQPLERHFLIQNTFREMGRWQYRILTHPQYTKLIAICIPYATSSQIKTLFMRCFGYFGKFFLHQQASLTIQAILLRVAEIIHTEHLRDVIIPRSDSM